MKLVIHTGPLLAEIRSKDNSSEPMFNCAICKRPLICKNKDKINGMDLPEIQVMVLREQEMWCSRYNPVRKRLI